MKVLNQISIESGKNVPLH